MQPRQARVQIGRLPQLSIRLVRACPFSAIPDLAGNTSPSQPQNRWECICCRLLPPRSLSFDILLCAYALTVDLFHIHLRSPMVVSKKRHPHIRYLWASPQDGHLSYFGTSSSGMERYVNTCDRHNPIASTYWFEEAWTWRFARALLIVCFHNQARSYCLSLCMPGAEIALPMHYILHSFWTSTSTSLCFDWMPNYVEFTFASL